MALPPRVILFFPMGNFYDIVFVVAIVVVDDDDDFRRDCTFIGRRF